ncbi:flagellar assembly protein FliH [Bacillus sp. Marseille-Q1617]|uniref:flagellar assembly protein FliH n=1 Tax=Bacillus sp. Marseille-Q1617 TaxID=2736887 RepID=UPI001588C0F3|nr:flagellar assembly protein FliH [Bacillus sp. Marseille-Q1617]
MSRIIKSSMAQTREKKEKVIELKEILSSRSVVTHEDVTKQQPLQNIEIEKLISDAKGKAERILEEASEERNRILNQIQQEKDNWVKEREQYIQEAYNAGFQQGEEEGMKKGYQDYTLRLKEAEDIVESNKQQYYSYLENAEKVIVSLAIASAEKIIGQKMNDDPETFLSIIKRGLKEVRELPEVQIHCHPSKHPLLMENKEEIEVIFPANVQCFIYANDDLDPKQSYIETNQGRIIVSIDSQLKELKLRLLDILQGDGS